MPIYEYSKDSPEFESIRTIILKNCDDVCHGGEVNYDYIDYSLDICDFVFVNFELFTLVGFAIVFDQQNEIYIDVICNLNKSNKSLQNRLYGMFFRQHGGKDIIDKIKEKGIAMGKTNVGLRALKPVISYYSHLGFTFPYSGHAERRIERIQEFRSLMIQFEKLRKKVDELQQKHDDHNDEYNETPEETNLRRTFNQLSHMINDKLWDFYKRHQPGMYTEPDLRTSVGTEKHGKYNIISDLDSNGIKMIYPLQRKKTSSTRRKRTRRMRRMRRIHRNNPSRRSISNRRRTSRSR